jgi:hypothetical protein
LKRCATREGPGTKVGRLLRRRRLGRRGRRSRGVDEADAHDPADPGQRLDDGVAVHAGQVRGLEHDDAVLHPERRHLQAELALEDGRRVSLDEPVLAVDHVLPGRTERSGPARYTDVWARQAGRWLAISAHTSRGAEGR